MGFRQWLKYGAGNSLEHGITRIADALTSIVLLLTLPAEIFAQLAVARAMIAPTLICFLQPEVILYREFVAWQKRGNWRLARRLSAFRQFAWTKAAIATGLALILSQLFPGSFGEQSQFWALLWAFFWAIAPQIAGPDREYLRLSLQFRWLNLITLYQKVVFLGGTALVSLYYPERLELLACCSIGTALSTAWLARLAAHRVLAVQTAISCRFSFTRAVIWHSLKQFSLWRHLSFVIQEWVQTMDIFYLGLLALPAREVGLYAVTLKIGNLTYAIPLALESSFLLWLGRSQGWYQRDAKEKATLLKVMGLFLLVGCLQVGLVLGLAPMIFTLFGRGRWTWADQGLMVTWLGWILVGVALTSAVLPLASWLILRCSVSQMFLRVYFPWGLLSLMIYGSSIYTGGIQGAAIANVAVALVFVTLILWHFRLSHQQAKPLITMQVADPPG